MVDKIIFILNKDVIIPSGRGKYVFHADKRYEIDDPRYFQPQWYRIFAQQIRERDNNKCVRCGSKENLEIHHIIRVKIDPRLLLDPSNCITLCQDCHQEDHDDAQDWESYESPLDSWDGEWDDCPLCGELKKSCYDVCYECSQVV